MEKRSSIQKSPPLALLRPDVIIFRPQNGPPSEMMQFCLEKTYSDVDFIWSFQFGNFNLSKNVTVKIFLVISNINNILIMRKNESEINHIDSTHQCKLPLGITTPS